MSKVAVVTGASAGIGEAISQMLVFNNYVVVGAARSVDKLQAIQTQLGADKFIPVKCDLSKEEDIVSLFKFTGEKFGEIHMLVNNAGFAKSCSVLSGDFERMDQTFNVNVLGLMKCCKLGVEQMKEGFVINVSSIASYAVAPPGFPLLNVYSGSKFAVRALTEGLKNELQAANRKTIRVCHLAPGTVDTELLRTVPDQDSTFYEKWNENLELIGMLKPGDIAATVEAIIRLPHNINVRDVNVQRA